MAETISSTEDDATPTPMSVEEVIEGSLGKMTWNQILQAVFACIPPIFDNQQTLISVFTDAQPAWYCTNTNILNCNSYSNICSLPRADWNWVANKNRTIISDWDLECASSFIKGLPATCYFVGCLLTGFLVASLGDTSLGRKNLLLFSCLTMSLAALASGFAPSFWWYCVLRFICGAGRVSITISSFVLLSEKVGKRWRGQIVLLGFISLTLGILSLTGIAYFTRTSSWRALYIWTSTPGILYSVMIHFCLFESPRWLFLQGRQNEAVSVLKRIGTLSHLSSVLARNMFKIEQSNVNPFSSMRVIAKKRWAIQRLLVTMVLSFGVGMMYFGMFLGVGSLGPNIYLSSIYNSLIFLVSSLLSYLFWIQRVNRRSSILGFCTVSGATGIVSIIAGHDQKGIRVGLELTALFCACMVFNILFIYTVELFPTCVRNTAVSLSRQALLFASVFVPVLVVIGRRNELFGHTVFGVTIIVCGLLVLSLPETRGKVLCDTMEEQEVTAKDCGLCGCI
ncbi:organic cation/carnitine transporter 3-like [Silene latifolia]|uniref:organic cation/carnitine transporter 3-like n=1 Tax=Silene latifolia TaxID=37657 RepID=UPI003D778DD3